MKLEIGMYARTKRGQIGKIINIAKYNVAIEFNNMWQDIVNIENIIDVNFKVIELIEVGGDYVNGYLVSEKTIGLKDNYLIIKKPNNKRGINVIKLYEEDIESIVTRETFENLSYKVKQ